MVLACVLRVMLFAVLLACLAGVGNCLVAMPAPTLACERGSAQWQRSQTKRNDDCPNQFFHNVNFVPFIPADASDAKKVTAFYFPAETPRWADSSWVSSAGVRR